MSLLNWPSGLERTPAHERESGNQFDVGLRRTRKQIKDEMRRLDVDEFRIDDVTSSSDEPGVVLRWMKGGREYAVACDGYTSKRANMREIYLWVNETRMREQRRARTVADSFAAAALPSGDEERPLVVGGEPPHEVLGVDPDASEDDVKAAFRELAKKHAPDRGGDREEFVRVKRAKEQML